MMLLLLLLLTECDDCAVHFNVVVEVSEPAPTIGTDMLLLYLHQLLPTTKVYIYYSFNVAVVVEVSEPAPAEAEDNPDTLMFRLEEDQDLRKNNSLNQQKREDFY